MRISNRVYSSELSLFNSRVNSQNWTLVSAPPVKFNSSGWPVRSDTVCDSPHTIVLPKDIHEEFHCETVFTGAIVY